MSEAFAGDRGLAPQSANMAATLQRAAIYAEEQGHRLITLEHLLLALTEDPEGLAVLQMSRIDIDELRNDTANLVGRIDDRVPLDSQIAPQASAELMRVLDAASSAAGAKRRTVDGAIVLAALISEGSSAAAELLRMRGLTFDSTVRTTRQPAQRAPTAMPRAVSTPTLGSQRQAATPTDAVPRTRQRAAVPPPQTPSPAPMPWQVPPPVDTVPRSRARRPLEASLDAVPRSRVQRPLEASVDGVPRSRAQAPIRQQELYPQRRAEQAPAPLEPAYYDEPPPARAPVERRRPAQTGRDGRTDRASEPKRKRGRKSPGSGPLLVAANSRMRLGEPEAVEVRLDLRALDALEGIEAPQPGRRDLPFAARALTVRLRAADDSAVIETEAPETQWIESAVGWQEDEFGGWRWTVMPQYRGKLTLSLLLSSRTVGHDGITIEMAQPEQIVEIRVGGTLWRLLVRVLGWMLLIGGALATGALAEYALKLVSRLLGQ